MLNIIIKILFAYIICGFFSYLVFNNLSLSFLDKNGKEIKLKECQIKTIIIMISIMWIYYLPALAIDYIKRHEK